MDNPGVIPAPHGHQKIIRFSAGQPQDHHNGSEQHPWSRTWNRQTHLANIATSPCVARTLTAWEPPSPSTLPKNSESSIELIDLCSFLKWVDEKIESKVTWKWIAENISLVVKEKQSQLVGTSLVIIQIIQTMLFNRGTSDPVLSGREKEWCEVEDSRWERRQIFLVPWRNLAGDEIQTQEQRWVSGWQQETNLFLEAVIRIEVDTGKKCQK